MDPDLILFNHHGESMRLSRIPIYQNKENIVIISEDGGKFFLSKFIFNFLSCFSSNETDMIMAPISSKSLSSICQALSLNKVEDISLEDLQLLGIISNCFSTVSSSLMDDRRDFNDSKENESKLIPFNMTNHCNEEEQDVKKPSSKSLSEKTDSDKCDNSDVIHSNIMGASTDDVKAKGLTRKRTKYQGDPILEWKTINGKEELKSMTCQICGKVYERTNFSREGHNHLRIQNQRHFENHKLQSKTCECDIKFESLKEKERHIKDVHKSFIKCPKCVHFLANAENLELHLKNQHTERKCDSCDYVTDNVKNFRYHKSIHHLKEPESNIDEKGGKEVKLKSYECTEEECEKTFTDIYRLKKHQKKAHIKVKCQECLKTFGVGFINKHIANAHHKNQKNYSCEKCGKGFFEKHKLETHEEVEHKGLRFKCRYPDCDKKSLEYRDVSNRLAHERKKHGTTYSKFLAECKR